MQRFFKRNDGFTFVEALLQLVLLIAFTQLILSHHVVLKTLQQTFYSDEVLWEMFVYDFQRMIDEHDSPFRVVRNHTLKRNIVDEHGKNVEEQFDVMTTTNYIRRSMNTGNEPIMYGVNKMYVTIEDNILL
ncbi:MAG: hypothetical protein UHX00_13140, partial [Caryophanon sp.]|nr:hypothetical protein [Caryophanon sp.]